MSDTVKAVLIDGKPIGYFPPTSAENVTYEEGVSVKDALDNLTPKKDKFTSITSDANGFIALGITNDHDVLSVSTVGYSFLFWKRSNGYWYATVLNGSNVPVPNSTFNNVEVLYI